MPQKVMPRDIHSVDQRVFEDVQGCSRRNNPRVRGDEHRHCTLVLTFEQQLSGIQRLRLRHLVAKYGGASIPW